MLFTIFCIATNGSAAHLLKVGSKRRRTKAEMKEQLEIEELQSVIEHEREDEIKQLKIQLT